MKQKLKEHKGITLVALIITIIVLLILAVVAISAVSGNGILNHAQNAKTKYSEAQTNEQTRLDEYSEYLDTESSKINGEGTVAKALKDNLNTVISTTDNTPLEDKYGNKIMLPAGFKILVDDTTGYTADDIDVTKGIVVEDTQAETAGNQFVWIPVGKIYTDAEKTEANAKTINLGRYKKFTKNTDGTYTVAQNASEYATPTPITSSSSSNSYTEYNTIQSNAIAKNIGEFCTKANSSGGYYIGRYEARVENYDASNISESNDENTIDWTGYVAESGKELKLVSKADSQVWNYVTQKKASSLCQSMYASKPYESDLVNSYAWDTAIIFFQEFGENENYASKTSVNGRLANTGTSGTNYTGNTDVICNVYDMASNCYEWSTETYSHSFLPCTERGGYCDDNLYYTSRRNSYGTPSALDVLSFRPLLYM